MLTVALRRAPVLLASATTKAMPLPLPVAGVTRIHGAPLVATQPHPPGADTLTVAVRACSVPAAGSSGTDVGLTAYVHDTPACMTDATCPATVTVALRAEVDVLGSTSRSTRPGPVPDWPPTMRTQASLAPADHVHVDPVVTSNVLVPPLAGKVCDDGATEYEQVTGAAAWLTRTAWLATVSVPVRAAPTLAAPRKLTVPVPVPELPDVTVIHVSPLPTVHGQPDAAVTATDPAPPLLPRDTDVGATL